MNDIGGRRVAWGARGPVPFACVLGLLSLFVSTAAASTPHARPGRGPTPAARSDFNGDGYADLAIGHPREGVQGHAEAGSVTVVYGSAQGITTAGSHLFTEAGAIGGTLRTDERFGHALATGDFDADGYADLAIGAVFERVHGVQGAGAVFVLYGSAAGLTAARSRRFDQRDLDLTLHPPGAYGETVAAGDLNGDGFDDVVLGAPESTIGSTGGGGAVGILLGSASGVTSANSLVLTRPGGPNEDASFGAALAVGDLVGDGADDLVVGEPGGTVNGVQFAGDVWLFAGGATAIGPATEFAAPDFGEPARLGADFGVVVGAGDVGHDASADLLIDEDTATVGTKKSAGEVLIAYGGAQGLGTSTQTLTEATPGVPGAARKGGNFGEGGFAIADLGNGDKGDLVVGSPTEVVNGIVDAGTMTVLYGGDGDLPGAGGAKVTQATQGVPGAPQDFAYFGSSPFTADFGNGTTSDLAVSAYRADVSGHKDVGEVFVMYAGPMGVRIHHAHLLTEDTSGIPGAAEPGDYFGQALA